MGYQSRDEKFVRTEKAPVLTLGPRPLKDPRTVKVYMEQNKAYPHGYKMVEPNSGMNRKSRRAEIHGLRQLTREAARRHMTPGQLLALRKERAK